MLELSLILHGVEREVPFQKFLQSMRDLNLKNSYEMIVVQKPSKNCFVKKASRKEKYLRFIEFENTESFSKASNEAVREANGEFLIFLNLHRIAIVQQTLKCLIEFLKEHPLVGACGYFPDFYLSGFFERFFLKKHFSKDFLPFKKKEKDPVVVDCVLKDCFAITKKMFHHVGGFDEDFFEGFEEKDLCWRLTRKGHKIFLIPNLQVKRQYLLRRAERSSSLLIEYYRGMYLFLKKRLLSDSELSFFQKSITFQLFWNTFFQGLLFPKALRSFTVLRWHFLKCPKDQGIVFERKKKTLSFFVQKEGRGWLFEQSKLLPQQILSMLKNDILDGSLWNRNIKDLKKQSLQRVFSRYTYKKKEYRFLIQRDSLNHYVTMLWTLMKGSACRKIWNCSLNLRCFDIATLVPVFYAKRKLLGHTLESLIVYRFDDEMECVDNLLKDWMQISRSEKLKILSTFAQFVANGHEKGFLAREWSSSHLFFSSDLFSSDLEGKKKFFLLAFPQAVFVENLSLTEQSRDFQSLSVEMKEFSFSDKAFFLKRYQEFSNKKLSLD